VGSAARDSYDGSFDLGLNPGLCSAGMCRICPRADGPANTRGESALPCLFPADRYSRQSTITLQPGQTLVLLTDGYGVEAPGGGEWGAHGALDTFAPAATTGSQLVTTFANAEVCGKELQRMTSRRRLRVKPLLAPTRKACSD